MPYRSLIEALYTLNSPPVVSLNLVFRTLLFKMDPPQGSGQCRWCFWGPGGVVFLGSRLWAYLSISSPMPNF